MSFRVSSLTMATAMALATLAIAPAFAAPDGMRVARDQQTGQVRAPTAEESRMLDAATARMREAKGNKRVGMATGKIDPQPVVHANGSVALELDESSLTYTVAKRNADGTIEMVCVEGSEAAQNALKAPQLASAHVHKAAKEQLK